MTHVLTLVTAQGGTVLSDKHFKETGKILTHYNLEYTGKPVWLDKGIAGEVGLSGSSQSSLTSHLRDFFEQDKIDFFITPAEKRQKKLLLADMDSTIAESETLDELAAFAGIKDKVAEITARAMEGKLDFHEALKERVKLLEGLPVKALHDTLEQTALNPGAEVFVKTMRAHGAMCVLVSGGFTFFTAAIGERCGFDHNHGNTLNIENERLTGRVIEPILDKFSKVDFLENYMNDLGLGAEDCLTIGDGANDIPMLKMAGLGIGYKPKNAVADEIGNCIIHGDLCSALYSQGFARKHFQGYV
jgi:phosphoserine phosphatase